MCKMVFISMPINGRSEYDITTERLKIEEHLNEVLKEPFVIMDSFLREEPDDSVVYPGPWYLGASILMMGYADLIYFAKGWDQARGCKLEHDVAIQYGIPYIEE